MRKPSNFDPAKKYPLVFVVHGGPTWLSREIALDGTDRSYYPTIQFVNNDILVVYPNYRGSLGRGQKFMEIYIYPQLPTDIRLNTRFFWFALQIFRIDWLNRNKKPNRFLLVLLTKYLKPFNYYIWIKKRLNKNLKDNEFYT